MPKIIKKKEIRLQINGANGKKPNLIFKTVAAKKRFKTVAQRLVACQVGDIEFFPQDISWVKVQSEHTKNQLRQLGIKLNTEAKEQYELKTITDNLLRNLKDVSDTTERYYNSSAKRLIEFFGADFDARNITKRDAKDFANWLVTDQKLNPNSTARRQAGYASAFFSRAIEDGLLQKNPFQTREIPKNVLANEEKRHYIDYEECLKIWNVLNDDNDKLRFVLMRYLGLRSPSEINELKWNDFDWNTGEVKIRSPKLKRHDRKYIRKCPFKFELALPTIEAAYKKRKTDYEKILPPISHKNLSKHVRYWIAAAGLRRWKDLLNNFRRSAAIDLNDAFDPFTVSAWLGHSVAVANKHYRFTHAGHVAGITKVKPSKTGGGA